MKKITVCSPMIAFAVALVLSTAFAQSKGALRPCELYTQADAEALFGEKVSAGVSRKTTFPAGESCRYTFNKKGGSFGVTVKVSTSQAIHEEGINDSARDVFERQTQARKSSEHAAKKFKEIDGLSDRAFWEGNNLWLLKGDVLITITVHAVLDGSFTNREAMDAAHEEQSLALSRQVAEKVLSKMQ